ncbi:hypothetical protein BS50DRAFT_568290 [Corynespora cassiicola Philippines]|uniref:Uncharacterized protein n=1 Tax=Corynespora cassiicola Philippines TaxID=1448308 RepID=A0A2T2P4U4_CORCC|nr:hypothetical protein BS50DRAFT_568290 [Corynespora cassiicola Philippines]
MSLRPLPTRARQLHHHAAPRQDKQPTASQTPSLEHVAESPLPAHSIQIAIPPLRTRQTASWIRAIDSSLPRLANGGRWVGRKK